MITSSQLYRGQFLTAIKQARTLNPKRIKNTGAEDVYHLIHHV